MSGVNKWHGLGRLGKDPEVKTTTNGQTVCNFSIATSESWTDKASGEKKELVEWTACVAWGKQAETIGKYLKKGSQVWVEGPLQTRSWDKDGVKQYRTEVKVTDFTFVDSKPSGHRQDDVGQASQGRAQTNAPAPSGGHDFDDDSSVPF